MRMNIYVPDDLRRRMDAAEESVNWSAVACQGFEAKLGEIAQRRVQRKESTMKDVVERLRASKRKTEDEDYSAGHEAGKEWAKSTAEAVELQRLSDAVDAYHPHPLFSGTGAYSNAELFVDTIDPECDVRQNSPDFWEAICGDGEVDPSDAFIDGFAAGALEVWESVSDQI